MADNSTSQNENGTSITALPPSVKLSINLFVIVMSTIICIGGFCGNFVIASVILKRKKMQTPTNWFVFNLAISDIAIIVITIPMLIIVPNVDWPFGYVGCKYLVMPVMEHFSGVCVLTHTAVGVARYIIVKNSKTRQGISDVQVRVTIASIWIIAFLCLSAPLMGILGDFYLDGKTCKLRYSSRLSQQAYRLMTFTLTYVIPMVATGFAYINIHKLVSQSLENLNGHVSVAMFTTRKRQTTQMNTVLTVMYVLFAVTTLPLQLFLFLFDFFVIPIWAWNFLIINILFVLFYSQVVINPLVLFYLGENYRKEVYKLSICCCLKEPKLREMSLMIKGSSKVDDQRLKKSRAYTGSTRLGQSSGHMQSIVTNDKREHSNIEKVTPRNDDTYTKMVSIPEDSPSTANKLLIKKTINEKIIDQYSELLYDIPNDVQDIKAYYDDGSLMYIYDKSIGTVSLAHDNGRETSM